MIQTEVFKPRNIALRLSEEMFKSLKHIAEKEGNSMQSICRRYICEGIAEENRKSRS